MGSRRRLSVPPRDTAPLKTHYAIRNGPREFDPLERIQKTEVEVMTTLEPERIRVSMREFGQ